ncbi:MAG: hypothetical protein WDW36_009513 [Sanguina aurantia]
MGLSRFRTPFIKSLQTCRIPGGYPAQLDGPITLCARADLDPGRLFTGSIANLMLWNVPLSASHVAELFSSFLQQSVLYPVGLLPAAPRNTTDGQPCVFPIAASSSLSNDCVFMGGALSCPTAGGVWANCSSRYQTGGQDPGDKVRFVPPDPGDKVRFALPDPGDKVRFALPDPGDKVRFAVPDPGDKVRFVLPDPGDQSQQAHHTSPVCVHVRPSTSPTHSWATHHTFPGKRTTPVPATAHNTLCVPVCVHPWRAAVAVETDLSSYGVTDGTILGPGGGAIPRLTVSGQLCIIPFTINNTTYPDCMVLAGTEMCPTADGYMHECAPAIQRDINTTNCVDQNKVAALVAAGMSGSGGNISAFQRCINLQGLDMCETQAGSWVICPNEPRITVAGNVCVTPFTYGGVARADCVAVNGSQSCPVDGSGALEACQSAYTVAPTLQPRFPIRFTMDRQICTPAGASALSECLDLDGSGTYKCQPQGSKDRGDSLECAPITRTSLWGDTCQFPYVYRSYNRTDCVWVDGIEACKINATSWAQCSPLFVTSFPLPPANATIRYTTSGQQCAQPFSYNGALQWDCVNGGFDPGYCRGRNGTWEQCMPRPGNISRTTTSGQPCQLPFFYNDALNYDCISSQPGQAGACLNPLGRFEPCSPPSRLTVSGKPCVFPAVMGNSSYTDCLPDPTGSFETCATASGVWETCQPLPATPGARAYYSGNSSSLDSQRGAFSSQVIQDPSAAASPVGSKGHHWKRALGLGLGLGGGLLLLTIAGLALARNAYASWWRRRVNREMKMTGLPDDRPPPAAASVSGLRGPPNAFTSNPINSASRAVGAADVYSYPQVGLHGLKQPGGGGGNAFSTVTGRPRGELEMQYPNSNTVVTGVPTSKLSYSMAPPDKTASGTAPGYGSGSGSSTVAAPTPRPPAPQGYHSRSNNPSTLSPYSPDFGAGPAPDWGKKAPASTSSVGEKAGGTVMPPSAGTAGGGGHGSFGSGVEKSSGSGSATVAEAGAALLERLRQQRLAAAQAVAAKGNSASSSDNNIAGREGGGNSGPTQGTR